MKVKLSERIRPNSEAAPWVIDEVKLLEEEIRKRDNLIEWLMEDRRRTHDVVQNYVNEVRVGS